MSASTPLLTDTSRESATQNVDDYSAGVAAHINGDFGQHNQFNLIDQLWTDSAANIIVGSKKLRTLITVGTTDVVVVLPIIPFSSTVIGEAPVITSQPLETTLDEGASYLLSVIVTGQGPLHYQWLKDDTNIPGANGASYALTNIKLTAAAIYTVIISNTTGLAVSNPAEIKVIPTRPSNDDGGFFSLLFGLTPIGRILGS